MVNKFTQKAGGALSSALSLAQELGHSYIGTEHLLLGLILQKDSIASRILTMRGANEEKIRQSIVDYVGIGSKSSICSDDMTPRLRNVIELAADEAQKTGGRYVGTEHLLISLINRKDCIASRLLDSSGICISEIKSDISAYIGSAPYRAREISTRSDDEAKKAKKNPLLAYGKDLTELAAVGKTDPVLCRDRETDRIIRILCRRSKNNPCLIGDPGVGKTAVVEGLAQRIAQGSVPDELKNKKIITLDISSMIAGAKYRGEFEDRIKNVIEEVRKNPDVILFVDEMHIMVGAGGAEGAIDASNILKPSLARGEIRMIGATTPTEYRSHIEKDSALERRFQPVNIPEPDEVQCKDILYGLKDRYQAHHNVNISDEAINAAIHLSIRYIHDRFLPDKAIDLIDEACSRIRLSKNAITASASLKELEAKKEIAVKQGDFSAASDIAEQERKLCGGSVLMLDEPVTNIPTLCADDIAAIISEQTGIPCQNLLLSEENQLMELETVLSKSIIGQQKAIEDVASAIRRGRVGLCDPHRPTASFLFLGSSGVGKTELCRALAKTVFQSKDALIKLDMSEYMEKHSVSKLIGAPPGYVGYGEGGLLSEKVRRQPYSVVLFDEIEKAHPDVFNVLLQILDDGKLTDSSGRVTDFSSTIIIMTSNLIKSGDAKPNTLGFAENDSAIQSYDLRKNKKLNEFFRPEFINRIDDIILFSDLTEQNLRDIAVGILDELICRAKEIGIGLSIDQEVAAAIAQRCAKHYTSSGARHLHREIMEKIEFPLSRLVLGGDRDWTVYCDGENILFQKDTTLLAGTQTEQL